LITIVSLCILAFRIYRRHKRYGLGPRILSLLYIDGINLKSIGNILCIVGIIVAIFGLFNQWYAVSTNIAIPGQAQMDIPDLILIDGIHGLQMTLPSATGPTPLGSFMIPFSLLIGIGLVFLIISTIGISASKKLGKKYIFRGIRIAIPIIMIIIVIMMLGPIVNEAVKNQAGDVEFSNIFTGISSQPFGGSDTYTIPITETDSATMNLEWGLGLGGRLLLIAGIIIIMGGIIEFVAHVTFFEPKTVEKPKKEKRKKSKKKSKEPQEEAPIEKILEEKKETVESPKPEDFEEKKKD
ncbi:MAG: hypothetical protein KAI20_02970, partial [Thermoplasmatales archaeon]|nr:hypothetical protein [Thermoplasmatales archaeon]